MIKLPFYKQDTDYSCGPATLQMIFRFYGKFFSEKDLIKKLKTNRTTGTRHKALLDFACSNGFYVYINNESSLKEVAYLVGRKIPVIIHFIEPDSNDGHYAVIVGINKKHVILDDPWNGKNFKITRKDFEERWHSEDGSFVRWIMVVSDEYRHLGKQYLPKKKK